RYTRLTAVYNVQPSQPQQIEVPFTDAASLENVMHCWLFLLDYGVAPSDIALRMAQLTPVEMRMELKEGINRNYLINDAYNADYDAFGLAVDYLLHQAQGRRTRIILSDILQSGLPEAQLYGTVADLLRRHKIDALVGIGPQLLQHKALFAIDGLETAFYADTEAFMQAFDPAAWHDEVILIKGARRFAFEQIVRRLQKKVHETVMEIDLEAMIHNLNFFRSRLKPQTKVMIMAKAFSYGSGSYEVANALAFHHSDYITVAYADEGVSLREQGIRMPIMVVNAEPEGLASVLQYRLEPEIYSFRMLDLLREQLRQLPAGSADTVAIHVKLDTGMHRLGFEEADLERLLACLAEEPRLRVRSIFTHLATADDPSMDAYTLAQLQRFDRMSGWLKSHLPYGGEVLRHALNTAGICRFPEYQYDMVRLGIGLYGVGVTAEMEGRLETVSTFKTTIAQIRTIEAGEAVGYGRRFIAERPMRIGVLCVGYADGLNRRLSRGVGRVWIHGKTAPIIGNICMDMCMLDLTGIEAAEGDEVILFGKEWPVTHMADALQTIPYEVLTGISPRVKRVYYQA
ncbi:MAG: alanine racemase, partial [Bacteroidales bacterium]|nr:alanine racemase [Bacteroidales bacterium]